MLKLSLRLKISLLVLVCCVFSGLVFGHTMLSNALLSASHLGNVRAKTPVVPDATVVIPQGQDLFVPFILTVPLHTKVIWRNDDVVEHEVITTEQQSNFLNPQFVSLRIPAGEQSQFTFNQAGLYHYYEPSLSTWNATVSRVAANKGTPHFPLAMDGVIWVQGAISGLPTSAINHVIAGHDEFAQEFVAIQQPGGVTWHNFDSDPHFVGLVEGWSSSSSPVNPADIGLYRIAGTDDTPGGATATVLFDTPGLYYYYCRNHDVVDPLTHRAQALPMASEYPVPMEGFVLVTTP